MILGGHFRVADAVIIFLYQIIQRLYICLLYTSLLSKMMISGANVLLLDEPTNHLDMEAITALNNGLIKFPGVILFTSHDHQIVQTTANRIMEIVPGGKLIDKITTYDEYLANDEMARKRQTYTVQSLSLIHILLRTVDVAVIL